jgi:hypothetical protein
MTTDRELAPFMVTVLVPYRDTEAPEFVATLEGNTVRLTLERGSQRVHCVVRDTGRIPEFVVS